MDKWVIYGLHSSASDEIRYVGYTSNPHNRLLQHLSTGRSRRRRTPVAAWIRDCLLSGLSVEMVVIENGVGGGWQDAERRIIASIPNLLNVSEGGNTPAIPTQSRKQAGLKLRLRHFSDDHRKRISASKTGLPRPDLAERNRTWLADRHRGRTMTLSSNERNRRSDVAKQLGGERSHKYWDNITDEERTRRSELARAQMREIWSKRKQISG